MRLSRSRRLVLAGSLLLIVGVAGRASATTTPHHAVAKAAPTASASAAPSAPAILPAAVKPRVVTQAPKPAAIGGKTVLGGAHVTTGGKGVALTFDDGPDPNTTPVLLKMLAQQHVHATFCLIGKNVVLHPELVRAIVAGGHTLCNHTWDHDEHLHKKSAKAIRLDMTRASDAIHKAAPGAKIKYFRAPGGNFTAQVVAIARQLGMTSLFWQVDPRDWDHSTDASDAAHKARVIRNIEHNTRAGSIILSHDYNQPDTIAAYRILIPWLKKRFHLIQMPL